MSRAPRPAPPPASFVTRVRSFGAPTEAAPEESPAKLPPPAEDEAPVEAAPSKTLSEHMRAPASRP